MAEPTGAIAIAARGCCPVCRELMPQSEDGWRFCPDCLWQFKVEADLEGHMVMMCRQPAPTVLEIKSRVMIGLMGVRPPRGWSAPPAPQGPAA